MFDPRRGRARAPAAVGAIVMVLAAVALTLTHSRPPLPLAAHAAIAATRHDPRIIAALTASHWNKVNVSAVDRTLERVTFFDHGRVVAEAAVRPDGKVQQVIDWRNLPVPYGNWLAYQPAVLVGLTALFVLMAGVAPWRRLRNLDVAAVISLVIPVVLLDRRYLEATVLAAVPGLSYLLLRCSWCALGPGPPARPATPLYRILTRGFDPRARLRVMRLVLAAMLLVVMMVGFSSTYPVDVVYAVLEGATRLTHGVLPYGHMPGDVIHGDTYPLLSYLLYVPIAWAFPVNSAWDSVDPGLLAAALAAALVALCLYRAGAGPRARRTQESEEAGLRAALLWLAFPPLLITVSTGTTDVALAAMLAGALLIWRRPAGSTGLLAAAAWFKLAPAALLPIWLAPLRGRRLFAAFGAIVAVSVPLFGILLALGGWGGVVAMLRAMTFQFSRGSPMSVWASPWAERVQPLLQAGVLGLIAAAALRLRREPELGQDRARMAALCAAILIGLQLAADYWAFLYLVWVLPLLGLSLLERGDPVRESAGARAWDVAGLASDAALAR